MKYGKYYYYAHNTGLQNQSVYFRVEKFTDTPQVFFDPNTLSSDGTISLSTFKFSTDGAFFSYGLSESGSDWIKIRIRDVEAGKDFDETLEKVKFSSIAWTRDNKGFFYGCYPDQAGRSDGSETDRNEHQKLYYHRVGQPQSTDVLVAEFLEQPSWRFGARVSDCGQYLILSVVKECRDNLVFFADLDKHGEIEGKVELKQVVFNFESDYEVSSYNLQLLSAKITLCYSLHHRHTVRDQHGQPRHISDEQGCTQLPIGVHRFQQAGGEELDNAD